MSLSNKQISKLKSLAQRLEPVVYVGKAGVTDELLAAIEQALGDHELIKIKFAEFKEEKKTLAPLLAEKTASHLIMRVGNVMVLHRPKPALVEPAA